MVWLMYPWSGWPPLVLTYLYVQAVDSTFAAQDGSSSGRSQETPGVMTHSGQAGMKVPLLAVQRFLLPRWEEKLTSVLS